MGYRQMIESANLGEGSLSTRKMWESVDRISEFLERMAKVSPKAVKEFLRGQHRVLFGGHYDEPFAMEDVASLSYTDASGEEHVGPHWTADQVESATKELTFPPEVTAWDRYVAFNAAYADFCKYFCDEQILQIGYAFYFQDEDWDGNEKIWDYMSLNRNNIGAAM